MLARLLFLALFLSAGLCGRQDGEHSFQKPQLSKDRLKAGLDFIAQDPHPMGSPRQKAVADYLVKEMEAAGMKATIDSFTAKVPDPEAIDAEPASMRRLTLDLPLQNVYAKLSVPGSQCVLLIGSHYDSKRLEGVASVGANDSGSSSALLLELMRSFADLQTKGLVKFRCNILAVWFDGEEAYLREWRDGEVRHPAQIADHLYGSGYLAGRLTSCKDKEKEDRCLPEALGSDHVQAMLLLDMVGMPNVRLTADLTSDQTLLGLAKKWDEKLLKGDLYKGSYPKATEDDHVPFRNLGIPVLDMIDFENIETWHTAQDTPDRVSLDSMIKVGTLMSAVVQDINRAD